MAKQRQEKRNLNLRVVVFFVIFIYMCVHLVTYIFKSSINVYEVKAGKVVDTLTLNGLVVREEELVKSNGDGYITFFSPDQSKVYNGEIVYTLDEDGRIKEYISEQIASKKKVKKKNMKAVAGIVEDFQDHYDQADFGEVYNVKQKLDNAVFNTNEEYIQKALIKYQQEEEGSEQAYQVGTSKKSGILTLTVDDFTKTNPNKVTVDDLKKDSYKQSRLMPNALVKKGDVIYRMVTSENWYMVVKLTKNQYEELKNRSTVKVTFGQNNIKCNAGIETKKVGRNYLASLTFNKYMIRFINDRYLGIELSLDEDSGFKIPKSSVKMEEFYKIPKSYLTKGGNSNAYTLLAKGPKEEKASTLEGISFYYYADSTDFVFVRKKDIAKNTTIFKTADRDSKQRILSDTVEKEVVFCVNSGYAEMRIVDVIGKEENYYLIKSNTSNGVGLADHIAENYKEVNENRIIY